MTAPAAGDPPRIGPGLEGLAVLLPDLVAWLMKRHGVTRADAWGRVLDTFEGAAPCVVYCLPPGAADYGKPIERAEWFATASGAPGPAGGRRVVYGIDSHGDRIYTPPRPQARSLGHGPAGFAAWLRGVLKGANFDPSGDYTAGLAVAESEARRLWGWGTVSTADHAADVPTDWAGLVKSVKGRRKGALWSDGERAILRAEFIRLNGWKRADDGTTWVKDSGVQKAMAQELEMSRQSLDRHLGNVPDHAAAAFSATARALTGTR